MNKRSTMTPSEKLKEKLYKINVSEHVDGTKTRFDPDEFVRRAKEVRKTFKNENILPSNITY